MADDREPRTAAYRAPEGPQGGCSPRGPLRVLGPPRGFRAACAISADRGAGGPPGGASLRGRPPFGRCAPAWFCAVCAPCNQPWCFRWLYLCDGWSEAGFLSLCAASRFGLLLVTESAYEDYNLKAIYSSLAQCGCRGLYELLILARTFRACKVRCGPAEDGR